MTDRRTALKYVGAAAVAATLPDMLAGGPRTALAAAPAAKWSNWSGVQHANPKSIAVPKSLDELATVMTSAPGPLRAVGAGHSFTALVPTDGTMLSLDHFSGVAAHDRQAMTATVGGGTRLSVLARRLDAIGQGMPNMPDIDKQTIAGAIATATHGSGIAFPALHAYVRGVKIMTPKGEVVEASATTNPDIFSAARVNLGSLGIVTEVTLQNLPAFALKRRVWLQPFEKTLDEAMGLAKAHRNFEFYVLPHTGYTAPITHDLHNGAVTGRPPSADDDFLKDLQALRDNFGWWPWLRHMVAKAMIDEDQVEEMSDKSWKLLATQRPTRFNETEYHLPRETALKCLREIVAALETRPDVYFPIEFRFIRQDDAWLSPFHGRESCSIAVHAHYQEEYRYLLKDLGPIFKKYGGRPHWGKLHTMTHQELADAYPRWKDFHAVRRSLDPEGRMLNPYLKELFGHA